MKWSPWSKEERQQFSNSKLQQHIQTNPDGVGAKYEFKSAGRGSSTRYPLIRAVSLGASLDVIREMFTIYPDAVQEVGTFNSTPLHAACVYQGSFEVIQFLLQEYPEAAQIRNKHGYYPLHLACEYGVSAVEVIQLLIKANPQALGEKNKLGQTPYKVLKRQQQQQRHEDDDNKNMTRTLQLIQEEQINRGFSIDGEIKSSSTAEPNSSSMYFGFE